MTEFSCILHGLHAGSPGLPAKFSHASMHGQPAILAPRQLARTVKMHWLPGARMATPGARAQGAVAVDIL